MWQNQEHIKNATELLRHSYNYYVKLELLRHS